MPVYTASNGAIVADLTALRAIPSTDLPISGFVILLVASENSWFEYNPTLTSGDATPINNPANGRWLRIGRDKLNANRTYFVRTDGNDSNTGLANNSGGAFLTWAKAQDVLASLDGNGFEVTVRFTGTFTAPMVIDKSFIGISSIQIDGDVTTPSNAFVNVTGSCFIIATDTLIKIRGIRFACTVVGLWIQRGTCEINGNLDFNVCTVFHIFVSGQKAQMNQKSGYVITGNAQSHIALYDQGFIDANQGVYTVTLIGSLSFSGSFIVLGRSASGIFYNLTYTGSATGVSYIVYALCGLSVFNATFPGSIGGTVDAKGYYGA